MRLMARPPYLYFTAAATNQTAPGNTDVKYDWLHVTCTEIRLITSAVTVKVVQIPTQLSREIYLISINNNNDRNIFDNVRFLKISSTKSPTRLFRFAKVDLNESTSKSSVALSFCRPLGKVSLLPGSDFRTHFLLPRLTRIKSLLDSMPLEACWRILQFILLINFNTMQQTKRTPLPRISKGNPAKNQDRSGKLSAIKLSWLARVRGISQEAFCLWNFDRRKSEFGGVSLNWIR
uniref:Uncharacterized protein n=1 Tax=Romanomermis culicivorax TaxID=13658 RepID=A0A915IQ71_ROMCU